MPEAVEILLVEDNPADAELTIHALRKSKLVNHIRLLQDGAEALDFLFCRGAYSMRTIRHSSPSDPARFETSRRSTALDVLRTDKKRHTNESYSGDPSHFL